MDSMVWEVGLYMWEDAWIKEKPIIHMKNYKEGGECALKNQIDAIDKYYDKYIKRWILHRTNQGNIAN